MPDPMSFHASADGKTPSPVTPTSPMPVALYPNPTTTSGVVTAKVTAAATTNATSVKASPGQLTSWVLTNTSVALKVFRFYNKASAPVVGTDVPFFVVALPPNTVSEFASPLGRNFSLGIAYAITTLIADNDATAVAANDVVGSLGYV